jgi:hypothetical protein
MMIINLSRKKIAGKVINLQTEQKAIKRKLKFQSLRDTCEAITNIKFTS